MDAESNPITSWPVFIPTDSSYSALFIAVFTACCICIFLYLYCNHNCIFPQLYSCSLPVCVFTFVFKLSVCPLCNRRVVFNVPTPCSPEVQTPICYILNFPSAYHHHYHITTCITITISPPAPYLPPLQPWLCSPPPPCSLALPRSSINLDFQLSLDQLSNAQQL